MRFIDFPYGLVIAIRNFLYNSGFFPTYKSSLPIICVGNLSVGGNGKTPLVLYLVNLLKEKGRKPVVLSRGYGGSSCGPHLVSNNDRAALVGDEPLMLHRKAGCPVVVARKRIEGAKLIETQSLGNVIILDDGFQHRALARNLDIVCAYVGNNKALSAFRNGYLLPLGRFRESKASGLSRAHAIMFSSRSLEPLAENTILDLQKELPSHLQIFSSHLLIDEISALDGMTLLKGQVVVVDAFCGLAQPEVFFESLESFGLKIQKRYVFRDHNQYSEQDLLKIVSQSEGRPIVCSEKDMVKLEAFGLKSLFVARTSLVVEPRERFLEFIVGGAQAPASGNSFELRAESRS